MAQGITVLASQVWQLEFNPLSPQWKDRTPKVVLHLHTLEFTHKTSHTYTCIHTQL